MAKLGKRPAPVLIGGRWRAAHGKATREIREPATGKLVGVAADCDAVDVDLAVKAARAAQVAWGKRPGLEKAVLMRQVGERIRHMGKDLATLMARETGKPLVEAMDCIEWVAGVWEYYAEVGRASRGNSIPPVAPHQLNFTIKEPYGVVGAIVPFNFPLLLMAWKLAPAVAAGNAVVAKPPHQNPLSNLMMARAYELLPPGVINVITGDGAGAGEAILQHPGVDLIAFTGSTAVGRHIAAEAGRQLKKVNLELGGIDPFIVFADADLDVAVKAVAWARLLNAGQVCTSSKRIYLEKPIAAEFTRRLVEYVKTLVVGDPLKGDTDVGPLIDAGAVKKVAGQVRRAVKEGATVLLGGKPLAGAGHFFQPTILGGVKHGGLPTTEEIFGPVISLIVAEDAEEAIRMANDSNYGLGAIVYTKSLQLALHAMDHIRAGTFWVNDPLTDNDAGPFGGSRWSGVGRELGEEGLDAFREAKHVHIDYVQEVKSFWFPNAQREVK